jgi:hypothetical protein
MSINKTIKELSLVYENVEVQPTVSSILDNTDGETDQLSIARNLAKKEMEKPRYRYYDKEEEFHHYIWDNYKINSGIIVSIGQESNNILLTKFTYTD